MPRHHQFDDILFGSFDNLYEIYFTHLRVSRVGVDGIRRDFSNVCQKSMVKIKVLKDVTINLRGSQCPLGQRTARSGKLRLAPPRLARPQLHGLCRKTGDGLPARSQVYFCHLVTQNARYLAKQNIILTVSQKKQAGAYIRVQDPLGPFENSQDHSFLLKCE